MTIYEIRNLFPRAMHPEDAAKVLTDNTGQMYYIDQYEDYDGNHSEKVWCYPSLQAAWQAVLDDQEAHINEQRERKEWMLGLAIKNGYVKKD